MRCEHREIVGDVWFECIMKGPHKGHYMTRKTSVTPRELVRIVVTLACIVGMGTASLGFFLAWWGYLK